MLHRPRCLAPRRFTQEAYFATAEAEIFAANDSVELIDGHVVEMPPENTPHHVAVAKATDVFIRALEVYWEPGELEYR